MLTNLKNKYFIGDLSLQDADILVQFANSSENILEFGAGGSTQLLSQSAAKRIICIETDLGWVYKTRKKLEILNTAEKVTFLDYTEQFNQQFDMIFVDGVDHLRRQFAVNTWQYLKVGGVMIFHDTRRWQDFQNAAWIAQIYFLEISKIDVNIPASDNKYSNMTVLYKKASEPYVNWNYSENKPLWSYGIEDPPNDDLWVYSVE